MEMEIDLDNLVFDGLEEAQERNAERLDDADKKAQAIVADDDCGDACKNLMKNRPDGRFFMLMGSLSRRRCARPGYKLTLNVTTSLAINFFVSASRFLITAIRSRFRCSNHNTEAISSPAISR